MQQTPSPTNTTKRPRHPRASSSVVVLSRRQLHNNKNHEEEETEQQEPDCLPVVEPETAERPEKRSRSRTSHLSVYDVPREPDAENHDPELITEQDEQAEEETQEIEVQVEEAGEPEEPEQLPPPEEARAPPLSSSSTTPTHNGSSRTSTSTTTSMGGLHRNVINPAGKPAEAGILSEIYLENFMCHTKLRIALGRHANAITGDNGSGKSAVLAAIQICLGANARRTHRARNLKELIRRPEHSNTHNTTIQAKIQVTLLNGGPDAYKPEVYGPTITVQRCLSLNTSTSTQGGTASGSSSFALLDAHKKEQSCRKSDLYEMLDHLNIQVDNPVSLLDQEESKKFLCGKPEDKLAFFLKATDLERLDIHYAATLDKIHELHDRAHAASQTLTPLHAAVATAHTALLAHAALDKLLAQLHKRQREYVWALYHEADGLVQHTASRLQDSHVRVEKKERELAQLEETLQAPGLQHANLQARIQDLLDESKEQVLMKSDYETQCKAATVPYQQTCMQRDQCKKQAVAAKKEWQAAQQRLQEYRDQMMAHEGSAAESHRHQLAEKLRTLEEERRAGKDQSDALKQTVSQALRAYEELEPHVQQARNQALQIRQKLDRAKTVLRSVQDTGDELLAVFGPKVKMVSDMVEQAHRERKLRGPVVGPIGKYVKIVPGKEHLAALAEYALGMGILDRFIVTNDNDRILLNEIRRKANCFRDCGIFEQPVSARYSVPHPAVEGTETVASVLSIDEKLVFNCLVDNAKIDQKALALDKKTSEDRLLVDKGNNTFAIRDPNVKQVFFLPRGDNWQLSGEGNMFLVSSEKNDLRSSIGIDKRAAAANAEGEVRQLGEDAKKLHEEETKLSFQHTQLQRDWNKAKRAMQTNDDRINNLTTEIDALNVEIQSSVNVTFDPSEYEDDVAQAEAKVNQLKESEERLSNELDARKPEIDDLKSRIAEVDARNRKVLSDINSVQKEQQKLLDTQTQTQTQFEKRKVKVGELREKILHLQAELDLLTQDLAEKLRNAREYTLHMMRTNRETGNDDEAAAAEEIMDPSEEDLEAVEPMPVSNSSAKCEEKIKSQQLKIEAERRNRQMRNETKEEALEKFINAQNSLNRKEKEIQEIEAHIDGLANDLSKRKKLQREMRESLKTLTMYKFDEMLSMNDYSGTLRFDDGEDGKPGTLDLVVQKGSGGQTTDVKGLSGGERSFTTMCLLLALGEKLETPFRIFDEFDVFLDAQARKLVMQQMIFFAKKLENRQFIFITPQDLSNLKGDDKFKIFKLMPPVKHTRVDGLTQTTLNFGS